jgi:hypothetical protein
MMNERRKIDNMVTLSAEYVESLRQSLVQGTDKTQLKNAIIHELNSRNAFIVAKSQLSPQQYGAALESHIKAKFGWKPPIDNKSGDATTESGAKIEIKVSVEDAKGGFNYVQVRPNHTVDYYLLASYSITTDELIFLLCPKEEFLDVVVDHGQLAHGTKDADFEYKEFAYRPKMLGKIGSKGRSLWDAIAIWRVSEKELHGT